MQILKIIGIGIVILIAVLLILAIFIPKEFTISVSETINKPQQEVYDYIRILKNQEKYSVWVMEDPNLVPEIIGTDGTVGAIQKWNSKMDGVGEGEQEITAMSIDRIDLDLRFKRPMKGESKAANILSKVSENQTTLTSEFYSKSTYPLNLMSYFMGGYIIKKAQTQNLKNIKKILESK